MLEIKYDVLSNEELMKLRDDPDRIIETRRCDAALVQSPSRVCMEIGARMAEDTLREIKVLSTDDGGDLYAGNQV